MFNIEEIRKDFPMLNGKLNDGCPLVYLDNSATTFKPQCVIDEVVNYYTNMTANSHRGDYQLAMRVDMAFEDVRKTVADFINCKAEEVVYTSGDSAALNLVAYGYGLKKLKKGDVILSTAAEHASNILPWFKVAEETGATIEYIPFDENGRITIENFKKVLTENVKLVAIASIGNVLGYIAPVKEICKLAHENGAVVVIDGAQSIAHLKTDVKDWDCDFFTFSSHKIYGPTGAGVLYGKYKLLEEMEPLMMGGGSNARFDMCGNIQLKNPPFKFEAGTQPIEAVLGMGAAIKYVNNITLEEIAKREKHLHDYMEERLLQLDNVELYNKGADTGICTFNVKDVFAQDAASYLSTKGVCVRSGNHCAKILVEFLKVSATLRASASFYNTEEEIDTLIESLKTCTVANCIGSLF